AIAFIGTAWILFGSQYVLPGSGESGVQSQSSAAFNAHGSIRAWIMQCVGVNTAHELPANLQPYFGLWEAAPNRGTTTRAAVQEAAVPPAGQEAAVPPAGQEAAVPSAGQEAAVPPAGQEAAVASAGQEAAVPPAGQEAAVPSAVQEAAVPPA